MWNQGHILNIFEQEIKGLYRENEMPRNILLRNDLGSELGRGQLREFNGPLCHI